MRWSPTRCIAVLLTATMLALSTHRAEAMLAPATTAATAVDRTQDMQTVQSFLEQQEVAQHLAGLRLSSSEIEARLGNLSDQELHEVATKIHQQQPGRDAGGAVVTVLLIGILVVLFIYLAKRV